MLRRGSHLPGLMWRKCRYDHIHLHTDETEETLELEEQFPRYLLATMQTESRGKWRK